MPDSVELYGNFPMEELSGHAQPEDRAARVRTRLWDANADADKTGRDAAVDFFGAGMVGEKHGRDVVGLAGVGESEQWARAGDHTMSLVLAVGGVADFFGESVVGMLKRAHDRRVHADV